MDITENQIIQLSPDAASTKAGKKLATPAKWVRRFIHEKAIWGACQGSGKNPYTTMVDTTNIAFKCSCPSRKFPCKHSLGILFLYAKSPEIFQQETELAEQVAEWIGKRATKEQKKATKVQKPVDEKARQKRMEQRIKKMDAGVAELSLWLKDLVRTGMMTVPQQAYTLTNKIAARMVDAQTPALATKLQAFSKINFYGEAWQEALLQEVAKLYLLSTAYTNRTQLSPNWQEEIKAQIGWNTTKEAISQQPSITDNWLVLSVTTEPIDRLRMEKVWLYGQQQQQFALLLNFYAGNQIAKELYLVGTAITATLHYYPSVYNQRALMKDQTATIPFFRPTGLATFDHLYNSIADTLAINPFINEIPFLLEQVSIRHKESQWYLQDRAEQAVLLENTNDQGWQIMAASFGKPMTAFVSHANRKFTLLSIIVEGRLITFSVE